ncbi:MAG: glycoside hydrolase family 3 protein [Spirochaetaceae bacterium]|nr:glycoside hydrolase family 3 protein [Spirochaetaceae bacterium]
MPRRFCQIRQIGRFLSVLFLTILPGCTGEGRVVEGKSSAEAPSPAELWEAESPADSSTGKDRELASRLASALDDRLLAAQVIITGIDGREVLGESMAALLEAVPAGGIMLFAYNINTDRETISPFLENCSRRIAGATVIGGDTGAAGDGRDSGFGFSGIPPLIAVDHEGGKVQRFGSPFRQLPAPASYWETAQIRGWDYALEVIEEDARLSGLELRKMGITLNFAPVAEISTPENQGFLDDRSYGPDGTFVTAATGAFVRGMGAAGILCVVKHFPGNGEGDPHQETALLAMDSAALDLMIAPFTALVRGGAPAGIMVSHVLVPAWDAKRIASLSPVVMGDKLRKELGFTGIILGDDFSMAAVRSLGLDPGEAAVEALIAGADMVMAWPLNLRDVQRAIVSALRDGRLNRERLQEGAERVLCQKIRSGLIAREEE